MDYKEKIEVLNWHANYSKLNGVESRALIFIVSNANYKTGLVSFSYGDLANKIDACKLSVSKAIKKLLSVEAISISKEFSGRDSFTYRVRTVDDLNIVYMQVGNNKLYDKWFYDRRTLHGDITSQLNVVIFESDECNDCKNHPKLVCGRHSYKIEKIKDSEQYRKYSLWLSENPEPDSIAKTIKGKVA